MAAQKLDDIDLRSSRHNIGPVRGDEAFDCESVSVCSRSARIENMSSSTFSPLVAVEALCAEIDPALLALCRLLEQFSACSADADGDVDK
jgi:hypothetical protein